MSSLPMGAGGWVEGGWRVGAEQQWRRDDASRCCAHWLDAPWAAPGYPRDLGHCRGTG